MKVVMILREQGLETDAAETASEVVELADATGDPEEASSCWASAAFALMASRQGSDAVLALLNAWLSASLVSRGVLLDVVDRTAAIVNGLHNGIEPGDILWALHRGALAIDAWWSPPTGDVHASGAAATG